MNDLKNKRGIKMSDEKKEIAANIAPELVETSEEPNVFDELQDQPQEEPIADTGKPEEPEEAPESVRIFSRENMSKKAPTAGGEKKILPEEHYNTKVFTIKDVSFTALRLIDNDGNDIPPITAQNGKTKYHKVKLCIQFDEDNIKEYYPSIYVLRTETQRIGIICLFKGMKLPKLMKGKKILLLQPLVFF